MIHSDFDQLYPQVVWHYGPNGFLPFTLCLWQIPGVKYVPTVGKVKDTCPSVRVVEGRGLCSRGHLQLYVQVFGEARGQRGLEDFAC